MFSRLFLDSKTKLAVAVRQSLRIYSRSLSNNSPPPNHNDDKKPEKLPSKLSLPRPRNNEIKSIRRKGYRFYNSDNDSDGPVTLPLLEIRDHIFPNFEKLVKMNELMRTLVNRIAPNKERFVLFTSREGARPSSSLSHIYDVGTLASYDTWSQSGNDSQYVIIKSHKRVKLLGPSQQKDGNLRFATCLVLKEENVAITSEIRILCYRIIDLINHLKPFFPYSSVSEELIRGVLNPVYWSYSASSFTMPSSSDRLQKILEEEDIEERLKLTAKILGEELEFFNVSSRMNQKVREIEMKEAYLHSLNRLRGLVDHAIDRCTNPNAGADGHSAAGSSDTYKSSHKPLTFEQRIRERLKNLVLPPAVASIIENELQRCIGMDKSSLEYGMIQAYLDNLTLVPWGVHSGAEISLSRAFDILNEDHYGLEEVKDAILEHLAVSMRINRSKGRILCLVGPPGVGKTSIVKSVARALDRPYVRVSIGGVDDSCEIKGHRRTYIGSMPGKIIKGLQQAKSMDAVFCIDEVDKLSRTFRGDPSGALLEVFDPEQNHNFVDNYLDTACDLSRVIFICTANSISSISTPLMDRMEVIKLSGYTSEEKQLIVTNYVVPSIIRTFNIIELNGKDIIVESDVLKRLTDEYYLEPGVRRAKNCIEKIYRKAIKEIDMGKSAKVHVTLDNMVQYAGYPDISMRKPTDEGIVGLVTGLSAAEEYSTGFTMDIECDFIKADKSSNQGQIVSTGLAGKSLSESSTVAFFVAKRVLTEIDSSNKALEENITRVHFLEGGTKKDGPSAGVTIFSAVLSQALNVPVRRNLAMTGEITLKGKVMAVGKIKEKVTAALRMGIHDIIIPKENESDFDRLSDTIKSKVNMHLTSNVDDLIKVVFPTLNQNSTHEDETRQNKNVDTQKI